MSNSIRTIPNKNTCYIVRNLNGTTAFKCRCGSWIKHWKNGAKSQRATCAVFGCGLDAEVGAHVVSTDKRTDIQWWIAPLCKKHNHYSNEEPMYLNSLITLVSANKKYTCNNSYWP